jgi:hypothetical protein
LCWVYNWEVWGLWELGKLGPHDPKEEKLLELRIKGQPQLSRQRGKRASVQANKEHGQKTQAKQRPLSFPGTDSNSIWRVSAEGEL